MQVSYEQNVGTLCGLDHGIILEKSDNMQNRILLIPHADIQSKFTELTCNLYIDIENELYNPPFLPSK